MRNFRLSFVLALSACGSFLLAGCQDQGSESPAANAGTSAGSTSHSAEDHGHSGQEGKHGGTVIELDDAHRYHAELTLDAATRDVTLYFYGSEIGVAKAATGLEFELEKDGDELMVESKASPLDGETAEACSRFVVAGSALPESVKAVGDLEGHFHIIIDGKEYVGDLPGHHDHDHDHDHTEEHSTGAPKSTSEPAEGAKAP